MLENQKSVHEWCKATFSSYVGVKGRAVALLEEAVELALGCGVDEPTIEAVIKVPILKDKIRMANGERNWSPEEDEGEVADVLLCLYAYAEEANHDAYVALDRKMAMNRSRGAEYYAKKTAQKVELGIILPDASTGN